MKYDKFFELAKAAGIEEAELFISQSYELSFSLFHGEVDNYSSNNGYSIQARGLVNGKFGAASCDVFNAEKAKYLVDEIVANAKVIENEDPQIIFEGSPKYKKINTFNPGLEKVSIEEKMALVKKLDPAIRSYDPRVVEVQVTEYSESKQVTTLMNSRGLKLKQKSNYFVIVGVALAMENGQVKSAWDLVLDNDLSKVNVEELGAKIGKKAVEQLGGEPCDSNKYKVVLAPSVVSSFMSALIDSASAEEVQKHSSFFEGKLGQKVASRKVTIEDKPLARNVFSKWFDDEGVATSNRAIIKNGVLESYMHNLTTAAKAGVESTGNGHRMGSKIVVGPTFLCLKPGKKSLDELFAEVGNGVFVTEVSGLHAGLNAQSGNFSLQSSGFLIENGKKARGLDIITVSGNLLEVFQDVLEVGSDVEVAPSGTSCPSFLVKKLVVTGK